MIDRLATGSGADQATGAIRVAILSDQLQPVEPCSISGLAVGGASRRYLQVSTFALR